MRKRGSRLFLLTIFTLADTIGIVAGLAMAYFLRFHAEIVEVTKAYAPRDYLAFLPAAIAIWLLWLARTGCYDFQERAFNLQILRKILKACGFAVLTVVAVHFFLRSLQFSRLLYPLALCTTTVGIGVARLILDRVIARLRRTGRLPRAAVLVLGTGPLAVNLATRIRNHAYLGMRVVGLVSAPDDKAGAQVEEFRIVGEFAHIRELIREHDADEVIVAQPNLAPQEILDFLYECDKELASIRVVPNLLEAELQEMGVEQIDGIPLFGLKESPLQGWNIVWKRLIDIVASAAVLTVLSPLLLLIAVAIKFDSRGPVFFRQKRIGIDGGRFNIIKFRSMVQGAEDSTGPVFAAENDPRTTRVGRVLRRWNLDELPQLVNVLRGDMSLVGPRPERPHFVRQFRESIPRYMGRHRVKCGITGWAQVNGLRGNSPIDERVKLDLYYIDNWSIWLDFKILLLTLKARRNAY